jgi:hypothetical protein
LDSFNLQTLASQQRHHPRPRPQKPEKVEDEDENDGEDESSRLLPDKLFELPFHPMAHSGA